MLRRAETRDLSNLTEQKPSQKRLPKRGDRRAFCASMKNAVILFASIAFLAGCDQHTDMEETAFEEPEASTSAMALDDLKSGRFVVDAKTDPGAKFENGFAGETVFEFEAKGEWSFAVKAGMLGPGGADAEAGANHILPGARIFALVAKREDGTVEFVGDRYSVSLKPNESISFSMNEASGSFGDNRGSLSVNWSAKSNNPAR